MHDSKEGENIGGDVLTILVRDILKSQELLVDADPFRYFKREKLKEAKPVLLL